uniref:C-type lectin domain-containing protein n=1 Tax=Pseudonaja textilis TaxID=8673 RepID=A0A670Z6X3_PSETE
MLARKLQNAIKYPPVICPPDWIGHQGHCYKLSREEKNWEDSQNFCILHNASLAKITDEEMVSNVIVFGYHKLFPRNNVAMLMVHRPSTAWVSNSRPVG